MRLLYKEKWGNFVMLEHMTISQKKKLKGRKEGICADGNLFESRGLEHDSAAESTNFWTCSYLS